MRALEHDSADAIGRHEAIGQDDPITAKGRIHLHVLVQAEAEQVGHALAHVDHDERSAGAGLDDLEQRRIPQLDAVRLQSNLNDGLADVIGNGRFSGRHRQEQE